MSDTPLVESVVQIASFVLLVLLCLFVGFGVWQVKGLFQEVRTLVKLASSNQNLANQQQTEAVRVIKDVPQVTKETVKQAINEVAAEHGSGIVGRSGEIRVPNA